VQNKSQFFARKFLLLPGSPLGKLAGPAREARNMATEISRKHEITLLWLTSVEEVESDFSMVHVSPGDEAAFAPLEEWADAIIS
jgi:hypothetical protein